MQSKEIEAIKVSVLCLAYNHEKYIRETLDGFVNQKTNFKFEVLIHDDASTDHTASIIAEYAQKYPDLIRPIYQTENQFSKGVKIQSTYNYPRAKGKYFAWCEGDDYWSDETKLQRQYDAMEAHPECYLCVHSVQCINEDGSLNKKIIPEKSLGFEHEGVLCDDDVANAIWLTGKGCPLHTSSFFVRREVCFDLMNNSYKFDKYMNGDAVIVRISLKKGHIYYISKVMSHYRLFSIMSYSSRKKEMSVIDQCGIDLKKAKGELLFDEYSSTRFHEWIICSISNSLLNEGALFPDQMDKFLDYIGLTKANVLSNGFWINKLKYYFSSYAHPLYLFSKRVYHKIRS